MNRFVPIEGIDGVWARKLNRFTDNRGFFTEIIRNVDIEEHSFEIVQYSLSESHQNVARGLHSQEGQWQLVTLIEGEIYDFILSPSQINEKKIILSLDSRGMNQIVLKPGLFHGFRVKSLSAKIVYGSSVYYGTTPEYGLNLKHHFGATFSDSSNWEMSRRDNDFDSNF